MASYVIKLDNGNEYWVQAERHNARVRLWCSKLGYIGSYYKGSNSCGFSIQDVQFKATAKGPKSAAKTLLTAYIAQFGDKRV